MRTDLIYIHSENTEQIQGDIIRVPGSNLFWCGVCMSSTVDLCEFPLATPLSWRAHTVRKPICKQRECEKLTQNYLPSHHDHLLIVVGRIPCLQTIVLIYRPQQALQDNGRMEY